MRDLTVLVRDEINEANLPRNSNLLEDSFMVKCPNILLRTLF
jgi:hypothetical protein